MPELEETPSSSTVVESRHYLWGWAMAGAFAVALLLTAELSVRAISGHLPPPRNSDEQELYLKRDQLQAREEAGVTTDLVFTGASMMDAGVDPAIFDAGSNYFDSTYNASIVAMPPSMADEWIEKVVAPRTDAPVVVVGVHPAQLGALKGDSARTVEQFDAGFTASLDLVDPDTLGQVDDALSGVSSLVRYRAQLRSPATVWEAVVDTLVDGDEVDDTINARAQWEQDLREDGLNLRYTEAPAEPVIDTTMADRLSHLYDDGFSVGPLRDSLTALRSSGRQVVLVVPPVDLATLTASGMAPTTFQDVVAALGDLAAEQEIPFADLSDAPYGPELFHDKLHLASAGAERFSKELAATIDSFCASGSLTCPPLG